MKILIITVGTRPNRGMLLLIGSFTKRLPKHVQLEWRYVKHASQSDSVSSVATESENIMRALPKHNKIILLDETGQQLTSPQLATELFESNRDVTFVIGGAYGVSDEIKQRADVVVSFGNMVFPHQIVRLMLSEQIYRSYTIHIGHPYHHS